MADQTEKQRYNNSEHTPYSLSGPIMNSYHPPWAWWMVGPFLIPFSTAEQSPSHKKNQFGFAAGRIFFSINKRDSRKQTLPCSYHGKPQPLSKDLWGGHEWMKASHLVFHLLLLGK